jgi:hypothetical protein
LDWRLAAKLSPVPRVIPDLRALQATEAKSVPPDQPVLLGHPALPDLLVPQAREGNPIQEPHRRHLLRCARSARVATQRPALRSAMKTKLF